MKKNSLEEMAKEKDKYLFIAWLKKILKIKSPSTIKWGHDYLYDYLKSKDINNNTRGEE